MKLRTKLLLGVGILLFIMALLMYFLPIRFVREDIYTAADQIHELLIAEHDQLIRSQRKWVIGEFKRTKENTNAFLFMIYQDPYIKAQLDFEKNQHDAVWETVMHIASLNQKVGFVQLHHANSEQVAVMTPYAAQLYPIDRIAIKNGIGKLTLLRKGDPKTFVGYPLPQEKQKARGYTFYALIDAEKVRQQLPELNEEIEDITPKLIEKELDTATTGISNDQALQWAVKIQLMRALTPFYVDGLAINKNALLPEGLARVDETGNGYVILTEELYSQKALFDDVRYFKEHLPYQIEQPIANDIALVSDNKLAYVANTLLLDNHYLSIGSALNFIVQDLALASNKMIFLNVDKNFWIGFDGGGNAIEPKEIEAIVKTGAFNEKNGVINLNDKQIFFGEISSLLKDRLVFYDFHEFGGEHSILSTLISLEHKLTGRISNQLLLINLFAILVILFFIARMAFSIITPILKLSDATQAIVAGKYGEVHLPNVGDRKDEVATLTHAFGEMVIGLQEREKIRGVLDKVVSKEVADEILKSQIHLGGEDRTLSMLFADIRNFTNLTATMPPQQVIELLNACMTKISRVIEAEGGIIDKYVGDEVMSLYGAPIYHKDHALKAVSAGLLIIKTLQNWNKERKESDEPAVEMGIGVHCGIVVAGNMGAEDRLNYTVLGANVNLASRLCSVAKPSQLLVSKDVLNQPGIKDYFYVKKMEPMQLKGFDESVEVFEITDFKWT